MTTPAAYEAEAAVADFDGGEVAGSTPDIHTDSIAPAAEPQAAPARDAHPEEPKTASAPRDLPPRDLPEQAEAQKVEGEKTPRRSTVREKVSFLTETRPAVAATPVDGGESVGDGEPSPVISTPPAQDPPATEPPAPRRAGWWSRRFGGGE